MRCALRARAGRRASDAHGDAINALAPTQRHVTDAVTAVNFDDRGFDTLGEEFMLLAAVTGTCRTSAQPARRGDIVRPAGPSRWPRGGGFQGGVIIASALLMIYLAGS